MGVVHPLRSSTRVGSRLPGIGAALLFLLSGTPGIAGEWVQVANDGVGDPSRLQVDALAVYGEHVYVAVHQAATFGEIAILRSTLHDDHVWSDDTPPWDDPGEVTALENVDGVLHASTTNGQLWRRGLGTRWSPVPVGWPGTPAILHVAGWDPADGLGLRLCVLREGAAVACRMADGTWTPLPALPLGEASSVESGRLSAFEGDLVVGLGGGSSDSRPCEVWRHAPGLGWTPVTTDGFGTWDGASGLTWVTDMETFDGRLFVGTAGHLAALVMRLGPSGVEDVTPFDLYDCTGIGGLCPLRYNALAATPSDLYVGTRTGGLGLPLADVLATDDGLTWRPSNEPGFGEELNDTITAMGSRGVHVYAGVFNGSGFQVWRRNHLLVELIPSLYGELWEARLATIDVVRCLIPFLPCPPAWDELRAPIDEIRLGLSLSRNSADDLGPAKAALAELDDVVAMLDQAEALVAPLRTSSILHGGWKPRMQAIGLVLRAYVSTWVTVHEVDPGN